MSIFENVAGKLEDKASLYGGGNGASAQAGAGEFICILESAKVDANRTKTGKRACLTYKVVDVLEGDPGDEGRTLNEYISDKSSDEILQKKAAIFLAELLEAGVSKAQIEAEEDATYWDLINTLAGRAEKFLSKEGNAGKIRARIKRVATDKTTDNGKPYYNNYFNDDRIDEVDVDDASEKNESKKCEQQSPFKKKDPALAD